MTKQPSQHDLEAFVRANVHYCVSGLVSTLANGSGLLPSKRTGLTDNADELGALCEQAAELCYPISDYEEAAIQAGWSQDDDGDIYKIKDDLRETYDSWEACCSGEDIEPYDREIFEHWIVSDWFAARLEEHGEKVDKDFAGLTVWARTTTGQSISMDGVIEAIWRQLHSEKS